MQLAFGGEEAFAFHQRLAQFQAVFATGNNIRMFKYVADICEAECSAFLAPSAYLQLYKMFYKAIHRGARNGVAHCHVKVFQVVAVGLFGDGVEYRLKHCLVA